MPCNAERQDGECCLLVSSLEVPSNVGEKSDSQCTNFGVVSGVAGVA